MREADALDAPLLPPPDSGDSECSFDSFDSAVCRPVLLHGSYRQRGFIPHTTGRPVGRACTTAIDDLGRATHHHRRIAVARDGLRTSYPLSTSLSPFEKRSGSHQGSYGYSCAMRGRAPV